MLDGTGLYFYNARYYDPEIGRFISPDTTIPAPSYSQAFNRYSHVYNNPLKYIDPDGQKPGGYLRFFLGWVLPGITAATLGLDIGVLLKNPSLITGGTVILDLLDPSPVPWSKVKNGMKAAGKFVKLKWAKVEADLSADALKAAIKAAKNGTHLGKRMGTTTVIGRYNEGTGYTKKAQNLGANYFERDAAGNALGDAEKSAANLIFLDQRIVAGDDFFLNGVGSAKAVQAEIDAGGGFGAELEYLLSKGYVAVDRSDGVFLTKPIVG